MENSAGKSAIKLTVKKQKILSTLIRRTKRKVRKIVPVSRTICFYELISDLPLSSINIYFTKVSALNK